MLNKLEKAPFAKSLTMRSFAVLASVLVLFVANDAINAIEIGQDQFRPLWRDEQRFSPKDS